VLLTALAVRWEPVTADRLAVHTDEVPSDAAVTWVIPGLYRLLAGSIMKVTDE
jgi:hypothetical protein